MDLTELIDVILPEDEPESVEDIFAAAGKLHSPLDVQTSHGGPGATIVYKSKRFGDIKLQTTDPNCENERQLQAHYLWNASIRMSELISQEDSSWSVKEEVVLELGAGLGLSGIVATLAGAAHVVVSDYPEATILDNIRHNAEKSIPASHRSTYSIEGYGWGDFGSDFAIKYANKFSRIIAADCYWMPSKHEVLGRSMLHFLDLSATSVVFLIAGLHTGRAVLAGFFDIATQLGLEVERIHEENTEGERREWQKQRDGPENVTERSRWLIVAQLKRKTE